MSVCGDISIDKSSKRRKYVSTYDDNGVRIRLKPGRKAMEYIGGSSSEVNYEYNRIDGYDDANYEDHDDDDDDDDDVVDVRMDSNYKRAEKSLSGQALGLAASTAQGVSFMYHVSCPSVTSYFVPVPFFVPFCFLFGFFTYPTYILHVSSSTNPYLSIYQSLITHLPIPILSLQ